MLIDGGKIKEIKIKLFLSSRSEMQKVIETARAQSISMQTFMQMPPATPLPGNQLPPAPSQPTPVLPVTNQFPVKTGTSEIKTQSLPTPAETTSTLDTTKADIDTEKKDQDTESVSSKDTKRRRARSRTKSRDRSKSRERSRSRDRGYRGKDRYRDRRRRDRSRSRDRRRRYRDRSRSRERASRKSSRDRKREDRNDRNSSENNTPAKSVTAASKEVELPTPPMPPKAGFSNAGWVPAGSTDPSVDRVNTNPIGFSINKSSLNPPMTQTPQQSKGEPSPLQIPLPPSHHQSPQPAPNSAHPTSISHPIILPQPPPFPHLPIDVSKESDAPLRAMPFVPNQPSAITATTQPSPSPLFMPNQTQILQSEASKMMQQGPPGQLMMPNMGGWNQNMVQMMGNPHMLLGHIPPPVGINPMDKSPMPLMNIPMAMYLRPPIMHTHEKLQQSVHGDPRIQSNFNMQHQRSELKNSFTPEVSSLNSQKITSYAADNSASTTINRNNLLNRSVEIRNMSLCTTNMDIRRFFQGLLIPVDGVKIITDKKGSKVGIAYVRFENPYFKGMALKKNCQLLKNSIVEILHIDDSIFDKAVDYLDLLDTSVKESPGYQLNYNQFIDSQEPTEIFTDLIIHELPSFANDKDIYNLFKGYNIEDAFVLLRTGRKTATGYIRFRNAAEARRALTTATRLSIGHINVKAAICYEHEFADARDRKNMEEEDEEMTDPKDSYSIHDSRGPRSSRKPTYDREQDVQDSRYSNMEKRSYTKPLLPTPLSNHFDPRSGHGNSNITRYDRRPHDTLRTHRDDLNKKPYYREDSYQKPYHKESTRYQGRSSSRDDFGENRRSIGDTKKSYSQNSFNKGQSKTQPKEPLLSTLVANKDLVELPIDSKLTSPKMDSPQGLKTSTKSEDVKNKLDDTHLTLTTTNESESPKIKAEATTEAIQPSNSIVEDTRMGTNNEPDILGNDSQCIDKECKIDYSTDCIILKGLPFNANDRDILDFFSDEGLVPTQIHIMLDKLGQPAGDAFCEFNTVAEASRSLTKNKTLMGRSVVVVETVPREEMLGALGVVVPLPPQELRIGFPRHPYQRPLPPRGRGLTHFLPRGRGRGNYHSRQHAAEMHIESENVNRFGKPGCVLALENVPFRADIDDILNFFKDYFISKENVIRRFDENGKPTGDARVCFNTPEDTNRALKTLNNNTIFNRQIYLSFV